MENGKKLDQAAEKVAGEETFKEFYCCPRCGTAICGEKRKYFICPECGKALCLAENLPSFEDNYCGNCGAKITSVRDKALALVEET